MKKQQSRIKEVLKNSYKIKITKLKILLLSVWSDDELAAQAFLFFLAGFETVSTCMTFAAYEIARRPDIQKKLKEEIDRTLENNDALTYEVISKMTYLDMFISGT